MFLPLLWQDCKEGSIRNGPRSGTRTRDARNATVLNGGATHEATGADGFSNKIFNLQNVDKLVR